MRTDHHPLAGDLPGSAVRVPLVRRWHNDPSERPLGRSQNDDHIHHRVETAAPTVSTKPFERHTEGITSEDSVSSNGADGAIKNGNDVYVYSGTLDSLTTNGNVVVEDENGDGVSDT